MKKVLFSLLLLCIPTIVFASTDVACKRDKDNDYGVNKSGLTINKSNFNKLLDVPCVDANEYVYDFGDVLTDDEEEKVAKRFEEFEDEYDMAIVFYSFDEDYSYGDEKRLDIMAHDFYDANDFGIDYDTYSGVLFFQNAVEFGYDDDLDGVDDGFYMNDISKGNAQLYFLPNFLDSVLDDIYNEYKYGDKAEALIEWVDLLEKQYAKGPTNRYRVNKHGDLEPVFYIHYFINTLIAGVVTAIVIGVKVGKNKMIRKATRAQEYIDKDSINFTKRENQFVTSKTTSYTTSSSSGGGHSGGGSFGGGSSGGGRH